MQVTKEHIILSSLIKDEEYFRKVIPYIKSEYFTDESERAIFTVIKNYANKYNETPNKTVLQKAISSSKKSKNLVEQALKIIDQIDILEKPNQLEYLLNEAEEFCKGQSLYLSINKAIEIYDGTEKDMDTGAIPELMQQALSVSFDTNIGHDYDNAAEDRWDYYTNPESRIPFDIPYLNEITSGGVPLKTWNLIAAGVNVGKTMLLVYLAGMYKRLGYNVLYITNELNEFELSQRIDATILNIDTSMILTLGKEKYLNKFEELKQTTHGRLVIKEYPTGTCDANKIRLLLRELDQKKKFKPTVIMNDYATLNKSISMQANTNSGLYFEKVAEELRAVSMEFNCIMWTAAQFQTGAMSSTDPDISEIGMSQGLSRVADLCWAVMRTEQLDELSQLSFKQMKTRYHKIKNRKWNLGVDIGRQRLYSLDQDSQEIKPKPQQENNKQTLENLQVKKAKVLKI